MNIQDYTNRLNITDYKDIVNKITAINGNEKNTNETGKSFRDELKSTISAQIQGKISSSSITYPSTIREEVANDPYKKKIYNSSVEFESLFVKNMLNEMKKSIHKTKLIDGGHAEEIFEDMLYDEYAKMMSGNGKIGLAEQVYEHLTRSM